MAGSPTRARVVWPALPCSPGRWRRSTCVARRIEAGDGDASVRARRGPLPTSAGSIDASSGRDVVPFRCGADIGRKEARRRAPAAALGAARAIACCTAIGWYAHGRALVVAWRLAEPHLRQHDALLTLLLERDLGWERSGNGALAPVLASLAALGDDVPAGCADARGFALLVVAR
jgi:hypothetical protein